MPVSVLATLMEACTIICCPGARVTAGGRSTSFRSPWVLSSTATFWSVSCVRLTMSNSSTRSNECTCRNASTYTGSARPVICCTLASRSAKRAPSAAACPATDLPRAAPKSSSSSMLSTAPPPFRSRSCRNTMHSSGPTLFSSTSASWPRAHSAFWEASSSTLVSCDRPWFEAHSAFSSAAAQLWLASSALPPSTRRARMHCVRRTALSVFSPPHVCCLTSLYRFTIRRSTSFVVAAGRLAFMQSFVKDTPSMAERRKSPPSSSVRSGDDFLLSAFCSSWVSSGAPPS
mmetsp:Transcript_68232/g.177587  ORF Transcript_68232/g.177587 Transcript_68232/m.177587 type:complete len:288 (-) Transcript_68232:941-1804(-)